MRGKLAPRPWGSIFDCYFLTLRAPVSEQEIAVQLLRRQKAAAMDLATTACTPGIRRAGTSSRRRCSGPT